MDTFQRKRPDTDRQSVRQTFSQSDRLLLPADIKTAAVD